MKAEEIPHQELKIKFILQPDKLTTLGCKTIGVQNVTVKETVLSGGNR